MTDLQSTDLLFPQPAPLVAGTVESAPRHTGPVAAVAIERSVDRVFDYAVPAKFVAEIRVGQRVRVPLGRGNKSAFGYVVGILDHSQHPSLKPIQDIDDDRVLVSTKMMELARWIARYYVSPLGMVLESIIPSAVKKRIGMGYTRTVRLIKSPEDVQSAIEAAKGKKKRKTLLSRLLQLKPGETIALHTLAFEADVSVATALKLRADGFIDVTDEPDHASLQSDDTSRQLTPPKHALNAEQATAVDAVASRLDRFSVNLLFGVTGSGKTEVYLKTIEQVVAAGRQAIVLVPEIALTPQTVRRFVERFHGIAVLHSALTNTERHQSWHRISSGQAKVIVGARSAIFAPTQHLGLIVVDEEHESSYKQDTVPRYNARDVAIKRGQLEGVPVILGSATPSLETWSNVIAAEKKAADTQSAAESRTAVAPLRGTGVSPVSSSAPHGLVPQAVSSSVPHGLAYQTVAPGASADRQIVARSIMIAAEEKASDATHAAVAEASASAQRLPPAKTIREDGSFDSASANSLSTAETVHPVGGDAASDEGSTSSTEGSESYAFGGTTSGLSRAASDGSRASETLGSATLTEGSASYASGSETSIKGSVTSTEGSATSVVGSATSIEGRTTSFGQIVSDRPADPQNAAGCQGQVSLSLPLPIDTSENKDKGTYPCHPADVAVNPVADAQPSSSPKPQALSPKPSSSGPKPQVQYLLRLPGRVRGLSMPKVEVIDMRVANKLRKGVHLIGMRLEKLMHETFAAGQQAILLLNRRGYANCIFCSHCNEAIQCKYCDTTMTYHRAAPMNPMSSRTEAGLHTGQMHCHYCLAVNALPASCPTCGKRLALFGLGTQRVEEELKKKFPDLPYARVDSDTMRSKTDYEALLARFGRGEIKLMLGTQMIAKGLDYPNVTLVGVISGDTALSLPDFRSAERTFQLITQVAGRAGRGDKAGRVILQTFLPEDMSLQAAVRQDYEGFAEHEMGLRRQNALPPFGRMVRIILRDQSQDDLHARGEKMYALLSDAITAGGLEITLVGPMPCPIERIANHHRAEFRLLAASPQPLQRVLAVMRRREGLVSNEKVAVDVDPVSML